MVLLCGDVVCQMIDLKLLGGFDFRRTDGQTNGRTDICTSRVAVATEKVTSEHLYNRLLI